jgi:hypothetical protein
VAETFPVYGGTDAPHLESLPADAPAPGPAASGRRATYGVRSTSRSRGAAVALAVVVLLMMIVFFAIFVLMVTQVNSRSGVGGDSPADRDIPGGPVLPGDMMTE